jgi:hypothetical protein
LTRQQRRADERKANKNGNAIIVEHVQSKGYRIKVGGIYLLANDGRPAFFPTEVKAREALQKIMDSIKAKIQEQIDAMAQSVAAAKAQDEAAKLIAEGAIAKVKKSRKKKVDEAVVEATQPPN